MASGPIRKPPSPPYLRVSFNSGNQIPLPAAGGTISPAPKVRIDKWLWAVRIYKTRSLAIAACRAGHVKVNGESIKPSHEVRLREIITAQTGVMTRTVKVIGFTENRVGAKIVPNFMEDLTPASEYEKSREINLTPWYLRKKGAGRPTKKDRRLMEQLRTESSEGD